jgi:hypothetical protein
MQPPSFPKAIGLGEKIERGRSTALEASRS